MAIPFRILINNGRLSDMVAVAQLVERRVVVSVVEGSSPFSHPKYLVAKDLRRAGGTLLAVTPWPATTYNYFGFL